MRIPGIVENTAAETLWWQHGEIIQECEGRRRGWEACYGSRHGCPYGCDGSGWREVEDGDQTPRFLEVIHAGKLYTPCECNMASPQTVKKSFEAWIERRNMMANKYRIPVNGGEAKVTPAQFDAALNWAANTEADPDMPFRIETVFFERNNWANGQRRCCTKLAEKGVLRRVGVGYVLPPEARRHLECYRYQ